MVLVVLRLLIYISLRLRSKNGRGCQGIPELGGSTRVAVWRNLGSFQRHYRWISVASDSFQGFAITSDPLFRYNTTSARRHWPLLPTSCSTNTCLHLSTRSFNSNLCGT